MEERDKDRLQNEAQAGLDHHTTSPSVLGYRSRTLGAKECEMRSKIRTRGGGDEQSPPSSKFVL